MKYSFNTLKDAEDFINDTLLPSHRNLIERVKALEGTPKDSKFTEFTTAATNEVIVEEIYNTYLKTKDPHIKIEGVNVASVNAILKKLANAGLLPKEASNAWTEEDYALLAKSFHSTTQIIDKVKALDEVFDYYKEHNKGYPRTKNSIGMKLKEKYDFDYRK